MLKAIVDVKKSCKSWNFEQGWCWKIVGEDIYEVYIRRGFLSSSLFFSFILSLFFSLYLFSLVLSLFVFSFRFSFCFSFRFSYENPFTVNR